MGSKDNGSFLPDSSRSRYAIRGNLQHMRPDTPKNGLKHTDTYTQSDTRELPTITVCPAGEAFLSHLLLLGRACPPQAGPGQGMEEEAGQAAKEK